MVRDPVTCADSYNQAVSLVPGAGVASLRVDSDRVELPLWWLRWDRPRQRVFAIRDRQEKQGADRWQFATTDGPIELGRLGDRAVAAERQGERSPTPAPRALLLTGLVRQYFADWFVHGTGGGNYDRITER